MFMKNIYKIGVGLMVMVVSAGLLAGCDGTTDDKNYNYFGFSDNECRQILFTCAQNEEPFNNSVGCGCKITDKLNDNVQERGLDYLVGKYLNEKLISPINSGNVVGELIRLGSEEQGKMLKYDVWGLVQEFYLKDGKIDYSTKKEGIMQFTVEQTNRNYIIRSYVVLDPDNLNADQKKMLTIETQKWLENKADVDSTGKKLQIAVKQNAAISFGRTMDAFVDYVAPVKAGTQEVTQQKVGTQQTGAAQQVGSGS
jgi:hypothetical protein